MKMYSCESIDNQIALNRTNPNCFTSHITFCNMMNAANGLGCFPLYKNYNGTPIDWLEVMEHREKIKEEFAKGNFPRECKGCFRIQEKEPQKHKQITILQIAAWNACNSKCVYCESDYFADYQKYLSDYSLFHKKFVEQYDVVETVKNMIKTGVLSKNAKIDITGGEPTIYPRFNELLACLLEYGCRNINILSNAIVYSPIIEYGISLNAINLIISIDAGSRDVHKKVKGVSSYDLVWENVSNYHKALKSSQVHSSKKHWIDLKYIIIENLNDSKREIDLWIKKAKDVGVEVLSLNLTDQFNRNTNYNKSRAIKMVNLSEYAFKKAVKNGFKMYFHPNLQDNYIKLGKEILGNFNPMETFKEDNGLM